METLFCQFQFCLCAKIIITWMLSCSANVIIFHMVYFLENIKDFLETTIVLKKEKTGLGICIVGGYDTHLVR